MSYSTDRTDSELDLFGSLVAATSRETTQGIMPVTPMMGDEVYLTTYPDKVNNNLYSPHINGVPVTAASMSTSSGWFFVGSPKDCDGESEFVRYQQFPPVSGTQPRTIPYPTNQHYSPAMAAQTYPYSPADLGTRLQGIAMTASSTTPQIQAASPELLGIGGAGQLGTAMNENNLLSQIVYHTHASTPRLSSSYCSAGGMDMGAILPVSESHLFSMPIMGPAPAPGEPLFMPVSYADMGDSGSSSSSSAGGAAAFAPNNEMAAYSSGIAGEQLHAGTYHIGQHSISRPAHGSGFLGEGHRAFGCADDFAIGTPVTSAGLSLSAAALSHSFTSSFGDISLGSSCSGSRAMSPAFSGQALSGAIRKSSRLARMRPGRSLSISEPFYARTPSPALSTSGAAVPHTSVHPYFPCAAYQSFGNALSSDMGVAAIGLHSDGFYNGSAETSKTYSAGAWRHLKSSSTSRLALLRNNSGPQARSKHKAVNSVLGSRSTVATSSMPVSIADYDSYSLDDTRNDDKPAERSAQTEQKDKLPSIRTPLTTVQREIFFRWLYQNIHDPKPRGKERERLRNIGNMSHERFKTWFANARRRYFTVTTENGVQRYTINSRFVVACQRANINLDD
ncbi:hypothetical protein GGI20_002292 [Coemansia sp. BCRC 34301]|nr:hypothetical protein GGI20_002292 [Coemansia sp. BCRC 34301]